MAGTPPVPAATDDATPAWKPGMPAARATRPVKKDDEERAHG